MSGLKPFWLPVAVALSLTTACDDDPLRPVDVAGTYALATVNGAPVPRDIAQTQAGVVVIVGGQISLSESSEYDLAVSIETQPPDPGDVPITSSFRDAGNFDLIEDDGIVLFSRSDRPNIVGDADGSRIRLTIELAEAGGLEVGLGFRR